MVRMADRLTFTKGHGTENDFVLVPDANGRFELTAGQVALLCDRRAGIGGIAGPTSTPSSSTRGRGAGRRAGRSS